MRLSLAVLTVVMASAVIAAPAEQTDPALLATTQSANTFSNNFFQEIAQKNNGNLIMSPFSVDVVLAMASLGASGNTAAQMKSALALSADENSVKNGYKTLIEKLNNIKDVELSVANKIYTKEGFAIKPEFKAATENVFKSVSESVDFSQADAAAQKINGWASAQTHDRIKEIVNANDLGPLTALVLLNAVYFKGNWATQFNPKATADLPFNLNAQTKKNVPTMYRKGDIKFGVLPELKASFVELPYKGNELSMVIILPDEIEGLTEVENKLKGVSLDSLLSKGYEQEVELYLPKFTIESTLELEEPLKKLGMTDMFDTSADFSNIADAPLYVSKVIQKAFIQVNEEGSEAAAVTAKVMMLRCMLITKRILVDRPFYYAIITTIKDQDSKVSIPLFQGRITDIA
ncbi:serpin B6-like isoform X3 [Prorops nasuta]|uniref:serpin B6-like isoform X3 n=1 Tax=Prorops nasuta TaxID=863751 RepID=UPI0034CD299F